MRTATCDHANDARSGSCGRPWWPCGRENHGAVCARGSRVGRCVSSLRLRLLAPYRRAAPQGRGSYPLRVEPGDAGIAHWPAVVRSPVYRLGSVICQMSKSRLRAEFHYPQWNGCLVPMSAPSRHDNRSQSTADDVRSLACEGGIKAHGPGALCRDVQSAPCATLPIRATRDPAGD